MPVFLGTLLNTVEFAPQGDHMTRVTITLEAQGVLSKEEISAFLEARPGMTPGLNGSFDALELLGVRIASHESGVSADVRT